MDMVQPTRALALVIRSTCFNQLKRVCECQQGHAIMFFSIDAAVARTCYTLFRCCCWQ